MKKFFISFVLALFMGLPVFAMAYGSDVYVRGYTKKDGTYVQPHHRTSPDNTRNNNYSTYGNTNPYTGQQGTKPRDSYGYGNSNSWGHSNSSGSGLGNYGNGKSNGYGF